jgi:hypothetical protein
MPKRGGMARTLHDPEFLRAGCRLVNSLRVPAGNAVVGRPADKQDSKRTRGHCFLGRNVTRIKTALFLNGSKSQHRGGTEQSATECGAHIEPSVVVTHFAQVRKRRFGRDGLDARLKRSRLQGDGRSHRNA